MMDPGQSEHYKQQIRFETPNFKKFGWTHVQCIDNNCDYEVKQLSTYFSSSWDVENREELLPQKFPFDHLNTSV